MGNIIIAISIHALREEGDSACPALVGSAQEFLSTPSARRATAIIVSVGLILSNFYPRPPRGGRPSLTGNGREPEYISIHALREEGDQEWADKMGIAKQFLSTPSARRATETAGDKTPAIFISIHALREEGDATSTRARSSSSRFLSTPSARRATQSRPE